MASSNRKYLFIDESGDPDFYGNRKKLLASAEGFQPYLILGLIETSDRKALRKAVIAFMEEIKSDSLTIQSHPSPRIKVGMSTPEVTILR